MIGEHTRRELGSAVRFALVSCLGREQRDRGWVPWTNKIGPRRADQYSVAVTDTTSNMGSRLTVRGLEGVGHEVRLVRVVERGDGELELVRDLLCTDYVNICLRLCTEVV